ncbi:hypothetical protein BTA51_19215 [Hahella sp. CCB-MM4]|nr:hypothetical protein BTA51_19215 [Hahella sp. CCB-MM4]
MRIHTFLGGSLSQQARSQVIESKYFSVADWTETIKYLGHRFPRLAGRVDKLDKAVAKLGQRWCQGRIHSRRLYLT